MDEYEEMKDGTPSADEEIAELREQLRHAQKQGAWYLFALLAMAGRISENGWEDVNPHEVFARIMRSSIREALASNLLMPDTKPVPIPGFDEEQMAEVVAHWEQGIPWGIVADICDEIGVDASDVLEDYLEMGKDNLAQAQAVWKDAYDFEEDGQKRGQVVFEGKMSDLPPEAVDAILRKASFGPNAYVLHVEHGGHPCRHPYESLNFAIEAAAHDEANDRIQRAIKIEHNGKIVMEEEELRARIDEIKAAPNN